MPVRIRSITTGVKPDNRDVSSLALRLRDFYMHAETVFGSAGYLVQGRRLTLPPIVPGDKATRFSVVGRLRVLTRLAETAGIRWLCQPVLCRPGWAEDELRLASIEVISKYRQVFLHFIVADQGEIYDGSVEAVSKTILAISRLSGNGFDNFRVGCGCNITPNSPFFPCSYHKGADGFSLAVEPLGLAMNIVERFPSESIEKLQDRILDAVVKLARDLQELASSVAAKTGLEFKGVDLSLAPYPDGYRSVAKLIEALGPDHVGEPGTLAVTSILANVLKAGLLRSSILSVGFNGVMFSPLEDDGLASANNSGHISLERLLSYASVCGCGIDMVPLNGDVLHEQIMGLILDVASLSTVLKKPLGVRVLPIPGKCVNEFTNFNHDFLVNTRILSFQGQGLARPMSSAGVYSYPKSCE